jgi:hypothetical protein
LRERVGIDQWMKISVKSILFFLCIERKRKKKKKGKKEKEREKEKGREYLEKNLRFYFEEDRIQRRYAQTTSNRHKTTPNDRQNDV